MTTQVQFNPEGKMVSVLVGESFLEAALRSDISIQHACGGYCSCTTCHIVVESGAENVLSMEQDEKDRIEFADEKKMASRLACQTKCTGSGHVVVQVVNPE